jgi:hypothetical protein
LAKASVRKSNIKRLLSFSKGDDRDFQMRGISTGLQRRLEICRGHIGVIEKVTTQLDSQSSKSDSSSTQPEDGEGSSSSGGAPSSRTFLDNSQDGQSSENSTGNNSSKRSASQESGGSGIDGSGDQGDDEDEQTRRPAKKMKVLVRKKFACPYYKNNPQVYGIQGPEKRFRVCQDSGFDCMADLR